MRFSTKAEYGLRAIINLADAYPEIKSLSDVSGEEKISFKYLERLMGYMRKKNLVVSQKGKMGGYVLAREPKKINVGEIIETLEGPLEFMKCESSHCTSKNCRSKKVWVALGIQIRKTLKNITLEDLIK
ncbi:MAG: RRF2 protein family [Candidatus Moranbacteria bacterium GW2011_GWE2_35_2-]|nr:MAG: RRF2 protein family [Candidatus Moranbacteria bacterium GW2011_GWE2_35_2-]KKQ06237.1 MAG: RRF2 protein family [Candidatus Moranbacteria bacterium GW2011_GWF1_36_4]KKQ22824.1 MAG: RRF2 protein family [Candidatus Moranbacteria bacterium GW2011_GWF2_37_11]KKQ28664.1 MAG: RRF2 protein family [Candidatus Moranbacteria bacterium GW2011_GWD1_37_17]KKQ30945.1 MAG: RRF2 protein family [Candidatus Moranbacteria bacterium GW2011_GWE1_37_24]KKQ47704.1 MAG: RRF2 protein family [Candidatus Moranbact